MEDTAFCDHIPLPDDFEQSISKSCDLGRQRVCEAAVVYTNKVGWIVEKLCS